MEARTNNLYAAQLHQIAKRTDQLFVWLMIGQWLFAIVISLTVSPIAWSGAEKFPHPHVVYAIVLGGVITALPVYFGLAHCGSIASRHVIAVSQMLMSGLLIHLTGGRIETHFHIFGSLAILSFYRDWKVLLSATIATALDHFIRGTYWPQSMFGVITASPWRWVEHAAWVIFEDIFLAIAGWQSLEDTRANCRRQAELEESGDLNRTLNELADGLYGSGARISEALAELASNAQETLAAVTETTTIVDEVRQTAEVSSHKARRVAEDAKMVIQISERGKQASDQTVAGMKHIREQMQAIADGMSKLTNQSKQIGEIIAVVDDLAQQSNLLSVNASIEAAKAGEYGRGFAVVADEVKNLSKESKEATAHVRKILNDISDATVSATLSTESGTKAVASGEEVVRQAKDSILALSDSIVQASETSTQIEVTSQQQLVGMQQVVSAMESVKEASNHNVRSVRDLEQAVNNLNELGKSLKALIESRANQSVAINGSEAVQK
ncbi:MAG TPA: methyl-accepting chemotaxis protein [Oculatellaceae cyanobacterium]